ncbi:LA_2272 family surface repeat-containing protein [Chitinophaga sp. CF418]|uniref:LA_2272 family surface repeat-containing protein n=1 Tax=Chitinophaga sp. CF418 TaxID=1855287 RepID=UPI0009136916|nr:hypothetical protein [Chitinophaga sp. CF418]SHN36740.1 hypothetical protein SAMN05216311_110135 [Chitinophaga sp. CF418]
MIRATLLALLFTMLLPILAFAETDSLPAKYLSLGSKRAGFCFGNSPVFTGFRFNGLNKNVRRLNGFDLALVNLDQKGASNGISLAVGANTQHKNNGLAAGGLVNAIDHENGIMLGLLYNVGDRLNGMGASVFFACDTVNGLAIGVGGVGRRGMDSLGAINGVAIAFAGTITGTMNGLAVSLENVSDKHRGLAVGVYNNTKRLKGIQIGLYNIALNNPKGLRRLPLINMHFGK